MKKIFFYILIFFTSVLSAQHENKRYDTVMNKFKEFYNKAHYDSIFYMFSEEMKGYLPKEKTLQFFNNNVAPAGKIIKTEISSEENGVCVYKTTFDNAVLNISISLNEDDLISGFLIKPYKSDSLPKLSRNTTKMILPFNEEWFVYWGGEDVEKNYHMAHESQHYAFDILRVANGSSYKGDPTKNESYFAFGKDIIAPCDAEVVRVIDNVTDNIPGQVNPKQLTGNTLVLKTANNEYILFAHLKENSIKVKLGDFVKQRQVIAQCGNSGNSTEAHLHLQIQNVPDFFQATGAKMYFDAILVNGKQKNDYMPVKEDFVKNLE
ncbi:MAG: peptidoglycan DD-metalloendopeptidase family protein [Flavobacteriaceae bacterium]